jgi:SWI/SNF-related matrix-associated actin-dependent regulator of chromatin subfamily D
MERKLDAVLLRKKLDFQDQLGSPSKQKRTLRIFISNTAGNQHEDPQNLENFPSWTLKVEGRILDVPTTSHAKKPLNKKFTQFLKSMYISVQPEDGSEPAQLIEWKQQPNQPNFDGLEIKRKGNKNLSCKITLNLSNLIEKFQTSPGLKEITNLDSATKSEIIGSIWEYLQFNKLQDPNDRLLFHCDGLLKRVFGCDNFRFPLLTSILNQHLFPSKPVNLHHTIR